ncbi:MAG: hypothetical protein V1703_01000 [Candidatus Altiarchaeota archaeon]
MNTATKGRERHERDPLVELIRYIMPNKQRASIADRIRQMDDVKDLGDFNKLVQGPAIFFASRGIVLSNQSSSWRAEEFVNWLAAGGKIEDVERREEVISNRACWRPFREDDANKALLVFFRQAAEVLAESCENRLSQRTQMKPSKKASLLSHFLGQKGVKNVTRGDLLNFLRDVGEANQEVRKHNRQLSTVIRDLPDLITLSDIERYALMLSNPEGEMTFRTRFPVRMVILPYRLPAGVKDVTYEEYTIALIPESKTLSGFLQNTRFMKGIKENNLPGALAFATNRVYPKLQVGMELEMQSDFDTKNNRCFGIPNWPDVLRSAEQVDYGHFGLRYAFISTMQDKVNALIEEKRTPGQVEKLSRAYPPKPGGGYLTLDKAGVEASKFKDLTQAKKEVFVRVLE